MTISLLEEYLPNDRSKKNFKSSDTFCTLQFSHRSVIQIYCSEKKEFIGTTQFGPLSTKRTRPFDALWREHCITNLFAGLQALLSLFH
jgi:hypothetical protein